MFLTLITIMEVWFKGSENPFHTENAGAFLPGSVRIPTILIQARRCQERNNEVGKFNQLY